MVFTPNLKAAIEAVCPLSGISVVDSTNRLTWSFTPTFEATTSQIAAADNVIATFPAELALTIPVIPIGMVGSYKQNLQVEGGNFLIMVRRLKLVGLQRLMLLGNSRLRIT